MPIQDQWRFCDKCFGMFFDGAPNTVCPAGDRHHAQGFMFTLPFGDPETQQPKPTGGASVTTKRGAERLKRSR